MKNQRNKNLDLARGLAAIFVVFIHICFPGKLGIVGSDLGCLCNVLFFLIAGYFAMHNTREKIVRKAFKSFALVLISYLIYAVIYRDSVAVIVRGLPNVFIGNINRCGNLWFAMALVYCYAIYFFIGNMDKKYVLSLPIIIAILYSTYWQLEYAPLLSTFFLGIPSFFLGNYVAQKDWGGGGYSKLYVSGIVIGLLLNFANLMDGLVAARLHYLGAIIYAFSVFMWAIFTPEIDCSNIVLKNVEIIGRRYYIYFYVFQYLTIQFLRRCSLCSWALKIYDAFSIEITIVEYVLPLIVVVALFIESLVLEYALSHLRTYLKEFSKKHF